MYTSVSIRGLATALCSIQVLHTMFNPSFIFNVKALNFMLRLGFYTLKSVKVLCYWFSSFDLIDLVLLIMLKFIIVIISLFTSNKINL